jgi:hypothetical protein
LVAGVLLLSLVSCGDDQEPVATTTEAGCEGRGDPLAVGLSRESEDGRVRAELVSATPIPPETGDNRWTLRLSDETGAELSGAEVVAHALMPDHMHGPPPQGAVEGETGL